MNQLVKEPPSSKDASDGTEQHEFMYDDKYKLRPDLMPACKEAAQQRNHVISMVWGDWENNPPEIHLEERLWYRGQRFSGKADYVGIRDGRALIIDYKFGRMAVGGAQENHQLYWLAVLVHMHFPVNQITVSIVQPHCGPPSVHTFNSSDLIRARRRVLHVLRLINSPNATLTAGPVQCKYCNALSICPAAAAQHSVIAKIDDGMVVQLTSAHLSGLLDALPVVRKLCDKLDAEAVIRLQQDAGAVNGYELRRGSSKRSIKDSAVAIDKLSAAGVINADGIAAASTLGLGKLKRVVREYNEVGARDADQIIKEVLGETLEVSEGRVHACRIES